MKDQLTSRGSVTAGKASPRHTPGKFLTHPRTLTFIILGIFAVWLRLRLLGYSEIWHDQARTLNMALQWLHGGSLPLAGDLASLGVHNAPLVEYLYAIPLWFKEDIMGVCWFISIINLLGILVAGLATGRVFGWRVAWWSSLLFAVNPWAVEYGRLIWMVSFVPGFAAALYACVLLYFTDEAKPRYLILGALCLSATIQTHLTAITLLVVLGIVAARHWRRIRITPLLIAAGLFVLSFLPFIIFHITSGFSDFQAMRSGLDNRMDVNVSAIELAINLSCDQTVYNAPVMEHILDNPAARFLLELSETLTMGWLGASILYALWHSVNPRNQGRPTASGTLILWLWFCLPVLFFIPHTRLLYNYYFLYLIPIGPVLLAFSINRLYDHLVDLSGRIRAPGLSKACRAAALAVFAPPILIAAYQTYGVVMDQNLRPQNQHGVQRIVDVRRAVEQARQLMDARPGCQLVVVADRPLWEDTRFGLLSEFVGRDRVRIVEMDAAYLYPAPCAVYFAPLRHPDVDAWLNQVAQPLPDATVRTPTETWLFYDLPANQRELIVAPLRTKDPSGVWNNGLQLNALAVEGIPTRDGGTPTIVLTHTWEINAQVSPDLRNQMNALRFGNHLLLDDNTLVAQSDGVGADSREWHAGDVFQTVWALQPPAPLQPGDYALGVTVYSLPAIVRVPMRDGGDYLFLQRFPLPAATPDE
ncbi:MAG: hypothetical protein JXA21_05995 [Anaerolineae bacterium]|nr:hypothetical protein [Anaerolineae bacterium]